MCSHIMHCVDISRQGCEDIIDLSLKLALLCLCGLNPLLEFHNLALDLQSGPTRVVVTTSEGAFSTDLVT